MKRKFDPASPIIYRLLIVLGAFFIMASIYQLGPYILKRGIHFQQQEQVLGVKTENTSQVLRSAPATPEVIINMEGATPEITIIMEAEDPYQGNLEDFDFDNFKGVTLHTHISDAKVEKIISGKGSTDFAARLLVETNPETYSEEGGNARVLGVRTEKTSTNSLIIGAIIFSIFALLAIKYRYRKPRKFLSLLLAFSLIGTVSGYYITYGQSVNTPLDFNDQNVQVRMGDVLTYKIQYFNPDPSNEVKDVKFNFQIPQDTIYKLHSTKVELDDSDPFTHILDGTSVTDAKDDDNAYFQNDRVIINIGDVPAKTWGNVVIQVVAEGEKFALAKTVMEYNGTRERLRTIKNPILKVDTDNDGVNDFNDCDPNNENYLFCDEFTGNDGIVIDDRADLLWLGQDENRSDSAYLKNNRVIVNKGEYIRTKPDFINQGDIYLYFKAKINKGSLYALENRSGKIGIAVYYDGGGSVTVESNNLEKTNKKFSDNVEIEAVNQPITAHIFVKNNESAVFIEDSNGNVTNVGPYINDKFNIKRTWSLYFDSKDYPDATFDDVVITRQENTELSTETECDPWENSVYVPCPETEEPTPEKRKGGWSYISNPPIVDMDENGEEDEEIILVQIPATACLTYQPRDLRFADVELTSEYSKPINTFKNLKLADTDEYLLNGTPTDIEGKELFNPSEIINRFEITRLALLANCIPIESDFSKDNLVEYSDVPIADSKDPEENYIRDVMYTGQKYNIIEGYQDGTVKPLRRVSLENALKIFIDSTGIKPDNFYGITTYKDVDFDRWSYQLIAFAETYGILDGEDDYLQPAQVITREKAVLLLYRTLYYSEDEGISATIRQFGWH